jgi:uncharacterized protein (DUF2249 family)
MADNELDVRQHRKPDKHPTIFATYADTPVGGSFVLVNNHDPQHLHEEFEADHAGSYGWEYLEKGPTVWRIRISKLTTTPPPRVLTNTTEIAGADVETGVPGVEWKLEVREQPVDPPRCPPPSGSDATHLRQTPRTVDRRCDRRSQTRRRRRLTASNVEADVRIEAGA